MWTLVLILVWDLYFLSYHPIPKKILMFALYTIIRGFMVIKRNVFVYIIYDILEVIKCGYNMCVIIYVKQWYMFKSAKELVRDVFKTLFPKFWISMRENHKQNTKYNWYHHSGSCALDLTASYNNSALSCEFPKYRFNCLYLYLTLTSWYHSLIISAWRIFANISWISTLVLKLSSYKQ